ncbi:hypothetical protein [Streptomyces endophyticus]|uniref:Uncharacterized protein n=1 Tax=Streptomyces endophyticus TaxID=714166 RepID=A0ABU6FF60_9ACTN|nr:hypothetical protein [Streptomyces endophyticus]MEB8342669.1 hypothetical protein [Streptomyces endophyticus]
MKPEYRSQVEPHLHPGEELIAACECGLAPGMPDPPVWLRQPPLLQSDLERRIKSRLPGPVRNLLRPSEPKPMGRFENAMESTERAIDNGLMRATHGKALHGGWDGQAGQFLMTHYSAAYLSAAVLMLAVTDRRVLVLADRAKLWQFKRVYEPQWEAPRTVVADIRANPKGVVQRGRVELVFADGSWIALVASVPTHAGPFAAHVGA